jgi:hypothetical protein
VHFELSIINGKTVSDIIRAHRDECIGIVREAYLAHADGQSVNPDSCFLKFPDKPDCRIIALPAYLGNGFDVAGLKWIASYPGNVQRGFPRASAVLVLNNYDTGYPFAILESSIISAARTAASAVLAAHWLSGQSCRANSLGIVGTGFIARYVYEFLVDTGWAIEEAYLEPPLCPLLDRQDPDPVEPGRPFVRRFAPVRAPSEGAGRESRAAGRDPLAAHPRVYRSTHDRRRNGDPQGVDLPLLPGLCGALAIEETGWRLRQWQWKMPHGVE